MIPIVKTGLVLIANKDGYVTNVSKKENIVTPWKEVVDDLVSMYQNAFGSSLHSIYLRGSVARGTAVSGVSDIDTIAVLSEPLTEIVRRRVQIGKNELAQKFSFIFGLDTTTIPLEDFFDTDKHFGNMFLLQTQGVCLYGEDLIPRIAPRKINRETAALLYGQFNQWLQTCERELAAPTANVQSLCMWITKRILRTGFALVMESEQKFTRDLFPCYELFSMHYPKKESDMRQALQWAINPINDREILVIYLNNFGHWLNKKVETELINKGDQ